MFNLKFGAISIFLFIMCSCAYVSTRKEIDNYSWVDNRKYEWDIEYLVAGKEDDKVIQKLKLSESSRKSSEKKRLQYSNINELELIYAIDDAFNLMKLEPPSFALEDSKDRLKIVIKSSVPSWGVNFTLSLLTLMIIPYFHTEQLEFICMVQRQGKTIRKYEYFNSIDSVGSIFLLPVGPFLDNAKEKKRLVISNFFQHLMSDLKKDRVSILIKNQAHGK